MNEYEDSSAWIEPFLGRDEQVLWEGRPEKLRVIRKEDYALIPFSIVWCGFALFWEYTVLKSGASILMALFGLPFVCVGIYFVIGRLLVRRYILKRTSYVITSKRILRRQNKKIDMLDLNALPKITFEAKDDRTGTIIFETGSVFSKWQTRNNWLTYVDTDLALRDIYDAHDVLQIIESAARKCKAN